MQVFDFGVDEWLALCKHFKRLSDKYPDDWEDPNMSEDSDDESVRTRAACDRTSPCSFFSMLDWLLQVRSAISSSKVPAGDTGCLSLLQDMTWMISAYALHRMISPAFLSVRLFL